MCIDHLLGIAGAKNSEIESLKLIDDDVKWDKCLIVEEFNNYFLTIVEEIKKEIQTSDMHSDKTLINTAILT